jgi:transposase
MSDDRYRPKIEILSVTDTGRRRRWTDAQKVRSVEESFGQRGSMFEIARRHDIGDALLVRCWCAAGALAASISRRRAGGGCFRRCGSFL